MINWIIITVAFLIFSEGMLALRDWLVNTDMNFKQVKDESDKIYSQKERNKDVQLRYLELKSQLKKYDKSFIANILFHIPFFLLYLNLLEWHVNIFLILLIMFVANIIYSIFSLNKKYTFCKEIMLQSFILIYILLTIGCPFVIGKFTLNLIHLLPYFLIIKIIHNNIRRKIKWLQY